MIASPPTAPLSARPAAGAPSRTLQWVVWSALGLLVAGIVAGYVRQQWTAAERRGFTRLDHYRQVPEFTLTERTGQPFKGSSLRGKVWLADFFFTACPGPCLMMNGRLQEIEHELVRDKRDVRIVSFSIAPEMDTPEVLRKYAGRFDASPDGWFFLTGDHDTIYNVAHEVFMLPVARNPRPADARGTDEGEFIHTTKIALVDREGYVRAYYDSASPEVVQQVLVDVGNLLREEPDPASGRAATAPAMSGSTAPSAAPSTPR